MCVTAVQNDVGASVRVSSVGVDFVIGLQQADAASATEFASSFVYVVVVAVLCCVVLRVCVCVFEVLAMICRMCVCLQAALDCAWLCFATNTCVKCAIHVQCTCAVIGVCVLCDVM